MTSQEIKECRNLQDPHTENGVLRQILLEIALQLALANERLEGVGVHYAAICERNRKMYERYMKMTEPAVRGKKSIETRKSKIENPKVQRS